MSGPPPPPSSSNKKLDSFPDVEAKLQKAHKQSAFEKEKADREAKRRREAAETAAVYESFVKSFDNEDNGDQDDEISAIARGGRGGSNTNSPFGRPAVAGGAGKRHFGSGLKSGPGSLGPSPSSYAKSGPGSLGPSPGSYGRRGGGAFQRDYGGRGRDENRGGRLGGYHDDNNNNNSDYDAPPPPPPAKSISKAFDTSDDEVEGRAGDRAEERAVAKPTLRLANLPPGTSPAVIKALLPSNLSVENVKILPPGGPGSNERKSMAAIVILSQETPATDMDAAVSSLQNQYLGYGFYLSLHRHLSSAVAVTATGPSLASTVSTHPFGAKPVAQNNDQNPNQQTQFHRGYAPPTSYGPPGGGPINRAGLLHVPVQPPRNIKQLQLIHKVVESVLEHGPEFEALLMSRPDVQREEKWAWLWDARSEGGVWYRWRLWEVITGSQGKGGKQGKFVPLFENSHAWKSPEKPLIYEYATNIEEFVSDPEYNSSDEDYYEEEGNKQTEGGPGADKENTYLNPLDKAKLVHLLARLPTTLSRIRKGDIARVTTFAITHASRGADEIVDLIVSNIQKPLTFTSANPEHKQNGKGEGDPAARGDADVSAPTADEKDKPTTATTEQIDTSAANLVGLYAVSDILSSSATSGVRHSWRYRQLFETALRERKVFEHLGTTAERLGWGRLRADKWKRSVGLILGLWEGWCVFPAESQELFVKSFENPPSLAAAKKTESQQQGAAAAANSTEEGEKKAGGRWKTVEADPNKGFKPVSADSAAAYDPSAEGGAMDVDNDLDGEAMDEGEEYIDDDVLMDSDIDGKPMSEDEGGGVDMDGEPMEEDSLPDPPTAQPPPPSQPQEQESAAAAPAQKSTPEKPGPRRRMRAVDMFADDE
jgi:U2-associated protein SR140